MTIFFINLFLCVIIYKFSLPIFKKYFLVSPNNRSSHIKATPSAGGVIFVLLSCLNSFFNGFNITLICFPLSVIGLFDDKFDLKPSLRIASQISTIFFLLLNSPFFLYINNNLDILSLLFCIIFIIFTCTGFINFFNFIDGLDGLLAGSMIIILATLALNMNNNLWSIVALLLGFIFFNWSPSKIFMGDVGSTFLGAIYVGILFQTDNANDFFKIILLASPLLGDACIAVIRRFLSGSSIIIPHKSFFFQRLNQIGWSHNLVSLFYISLILPLSFGFLFGNIYWMILTIIFELSIYMFIEKNLLPKFN
tara:strand:+ start:16200 stop:17123 length:924 start_codon:yes stop_codon:yes gene_type:complete